jgi:hypothetical protein
MIFFYRRHAEVDFSERSSRLELFRRGFDWALESESAQSRSCRVAIFAEHSCPGSCDRFTLAEELLLQTLA